MGEGEYLTRFAGVCWTPIEGRGQCGRRRGAATEKTKLDKDSQSVESWQTTQGGGYVAAGVGGGIGHPEA